MAGNSVITGHRRWTLAAAIGLGGVSVSLPSPAMQVNFSNAWVPAPGHGRFLLYPSVGLSNRDFAQFGQLDVGVVDHLAFSVEATFLANSGGPADFGNVAMFLNCSLGEFLPRVYGRISPHASLKAGGFGRSFVGAVGFVDWQVLDGLKLRTSPGYGYSPDGQADPHRAWFNAALDWQPLSWLAADIEVLSGFPNWNFGPNTQLGVAPGVTLNLSDLMSVQASLRIPLVRAAAASATEGATLQLGWFMNW